MLVSHDILLHLILILVLFAVLTLTWRLVSNRHALPCPTWLGWLVEMDNPVLRSNRASVIIGHLSLQPDMNVMDLGCGPGRLTLPLAQQISEQGEIVAADIQPGMLQRVKRKAKAAGIHNIRFLEIRVDEESFGTDHYDRILMVTVLGEIPDKPAVLRRVFAALKPGGILSITEVIADPHFMSRTTIRKLANDTGFQEKGFWGHRLAYTIHFAKPA
jgi:ubiquinone/menaquinone biosynthesis C-methylase UbiE